MDGFADPPRDQDQDQELEPHISNSFGGNEDIFQDLSYFDVEQLGSFDDQMEHWLRVPPPELVEQELLLPSDSEHSQIITSDMNLSTLLVDAADPTARQLRANSGRTIDQASAAASSADEAASENLIKVSKPGTRFSREAVKLLRKWFLAHSHHPFPDENDRTMLQQQTGLEKTQVMTWFANTRRRNNITRTRDKSPYPTEARDILPRPGTPLPRDSSSMNPLERWVDSPPENEPVSMTVIARAVASSPSASASDASSTGRYTGSFDGSAPSRGSESSADSHGDRSTEGPFDPLGNLRSRRRRTRRRKATKRGNEQMSLLNHAKKYQLCRERSVTERSFNRKDHLSQHLRLFHQNASFVEWSMRSWRVKISDIRSRCGICSHQMTNWEARVNHISEHFKMGKSMADWHGDWGFDPEIANIIENGMPPYLIEFERTTPLPFEGGKTLAATPSSAYELLKLELAYFMQRFYDRHSRMPSPQDMQLEACRIVLASETMNQESYLAQSWLRDLLFSDSHTVQKARFSPIRTALESRLFPIQVKEKSTLFESCPLEKELHDAVFSTILMNPTDYTSDNEIRQQSCFIIAKMEDSSITPSDFIATWLIRLIHSDDSWISSFRQRANIPQLSSGESGQARPGDFEGNISDYSQVYQTLVAYLAETREVGIEPSNDDLRYRARLAINPNPDKWVPTAADNELWLSSFRKRNPPSIITPISNTGAALNLSLGSGSSHHIPSLIEDHETLLNARSLVTGATHFAANDWNYYQWLEDELRRWAVATMSLHNPVHHIPSDAEFQHHARMATYNE
ncbi:hypothetical protein FAVG1_08428 [Fusarium avenaceum]|nr:hypothetical protein FAVG1_08428 [Fusarium avenaceum]